MRSQKELILATKPYCDEDRLLTWRLLFTTFLVFGITQAAIALAPFWFLKLPLAILAGLIWVRVFIFFHDWLHKAILWDSKLGHGIMTAVGLVTLVPPSVWQETHDYHHQNNTKMLGASIGSYPLITVGMYKALKPNLQFWYRFARNPLTILFGYFTIFIGGMCISAFSRNKEKHWQGPASLVVHFGLVAGVTLFFGFAAAFWHVIAVAFVACAAGGYLFYAQHNFPDIKLKGRRDWNYAFAALYGSSMMDMNPVLHWLTGNIGFHHVHHLNHKIPFYRLPEAMAAIPELQEPGRTSWAPSDVMRCLSLKLWDPDKQRMVTWAEAGL